MWAGCLASLLAIMAVAWGGGVTLRAEFALCLGWALVWDFCPGEQRVDRGFLLCGCGLLLLSSTAWMPVTWFAPESWRPLVERVGIALPPSLSPQPSPSLEGLLCLLGGLLWVVWLLRQRWNAHVRSVSARVLAGGIILVAATALIAHWVHFSIPFWKSENGFGPFPNRNHTGNVFAVGGVLALGCAADVARRSRGQALAWIVGAVVVLVALVINYSRGGVLVFVGAMALWAALHAWQRRSWKALAVGGSVILVVIAVVLAGGGALAARFAGGADSQVAFRVLIWRDALALIHASPWCGAGLGNFRALFPFYRQASVIQQSVLHPESDWLWLASELGWLGVVFALGAVFFVLRGAFPWPRGSQRQLRGAAFAAAVAALIHSAMDVPGHRWGSALAVLLVMVLARGDAPLAPVSRAVTRFCEVLAVLVIVALVIAAAVCGFDRPAPSQILQSGNFAAAEARATEVLQGSPLDWNAYFVRGGARACEGKTLEAVADFRRARVLEPHYAGLPLEEGRFWLQTQPGLALNAWGEALRRARSPYDGEVYGQMLALANTAALREQLLALARGRPALLLAWFQSAPPGEASAHREEISAAAPAWTPAQRAAFQHRAEEIAGAPAKP